jgi:hypothetical protein
LTRIVDYKLCPTNNGRLFYLIIEHIHTNKNTASEKSGAVFLLVCVTGKLLSCSLFGQKKAHFLPNFADFLDRSLQKSALTGKKWALFQLRRDNLSSY